MSEATRSPISAAADFFHHLRATTRRELKLLLIVAGVLVGVWAFAELADEVVEGSTAAFDEAVLLSLRDASGKDPIGPSWLSKAARDVTALGGWTLLSLLTLGVVGYLALLRKGRAAFVTVLAIVGGVSLSQILKRVFERPRPDLVPHMVEVSTASFPSGHAMGSAVVWLTLGAMLARFLPRTRLRIYVMGLAVTITGLVGLTRVYLGVHWPTDVISGWTAGAVWALLCWLAVHALQRRGRVERGDGTEDEGAGGPAG